MALALGNALRGARALLIGAAIGTLPLGARAASRPWPPSGKELAERGTSTIPSCASCHGARFEGDAAKGAPALAGKDAAKMMDLLYDMATNPKDRSPMAGVARGLSMAERAAVTAWLSRLPAKP